MKKLIFGLLCIAILVGLTLPMSPVALAEGEILGTYPAGDWPKALAFDGVNVWVASYLTDAVLKLRVSDGAILGNYGVGDGPGDLAFDGANIWVVNYDDLNVVKVRASDGAILGTYPTGALTRAIAFDGANIWVGNGNLDDTVMKFRASDGALLGTYPMADDPTGMVYDGTDMWVSSTTSNAVMKFRTSDGALLGTYPVGISPYGLAFDGANIWAANFGGNTVTKLRVSDGAVLGTYPVGANPENLVYDGTDIWVVNADGLSPSTVMRLRTSDGALLGTYPVGRWPRAITFDGSDIWVANAADDNVMKLNGSGAPPPPTPTPTPTPTPPPTPTPTPTPTPPPSLLPDLVVDSLSMAWDVENTTYTVTSTICNKGAAAAGASTAGVYIDDTLRGTVAIPSLTVDWCGLIGGTVEISGDRDTVEVRADIYDVVAESREDNNSRSGNFPSGGGCFIATAACGPDDGNVETLRAFRDSHLTTDSVGSGFVSAYYRLSPPVAEFIDDHPALKPVVRVALLPAVGVSEGAGMSLVVKAAIASILLLISASGILWVRRGVLRQSRG
jgi:hypothetical protein